MLTISFVFYYIAIVDHMPAIYGTCDNGSFRCGKERNPAFLYKNEHRNHLSFSKNLTEEYYSVLVVVLYSNISADNNANANYAVI